MLRRLYGRQLQIMRPGLCEFATAWETRVVLYAADHNFGFDIADLL